VPVFSVFPISQNAKFAAARMEAGQRRQDEGDRFLPIPAVEPYRGGRTFFPDGSLPARSA
jgi:hypothetical protein